MSLSNSGSLVAVWVNSLATAAQCSFCSGRRNKFCHDTFHARILHQNFRHRSFWNPQISFWFSHCQLPIFVDCSPDIFNILRCSACCRPSRTWITFKRFSTILEAFMSHFYLCCTHCIIHKSFLNHLIVSTEECSRKIWCRFIALLTQSLSMCTEHGHPVHTLSQHHLPPPLTGSVKSSLFTQAHSSPLSLAARLHQFSLY